MTEVRDWQKDMVVQFTLKDREILNDGGEERIVSVEGLGDLFKQLAAEKERADKAEAEAEKWRIEAFTENVQNNYLLWLNNKGKK